MPLQELNLVIACITCFICFCLVIVLASWWWRLRETRTPLRLFILGVWLAKLGVWFWAATGIVQIVVFDMTQPLITLPSRIGVMIAVIIMAWVTTKYYRSVGR